LNEFFNRQDAKDAKMETTEQFTGLKLTAKTPSRGAGQSFNLFSPTLRGSAVK
jgi:hypothetical protein